MYENLLLIALAILAFCAFKSTISYVFKIAIYASLIYMILTMICK